MRPQRGGPHIGQYGLGAVEHPWQIHRDGAFPLFKLRFANRR